MVRSSVASGYGTGSPPIPWYNGPYPHQAHHTEPLTALCPTPAYSREEEGWGLRGLMWGVPPHHPMLASDRESLAGLIFLTHGCAARHTTPLDIFQGIHHTN